MAEQEISSIRIKSLRIENYKALDLLELEFPEPVLSNEPDVLVMGSKNGLGKTSVLECCALLILIISLDPKRIDLSRYSGVPLSLPDFFIRAGTERILIESLVQVASQKIRVKFQINKDGTIRLEHSTEIGRLFDKTRRLDSPSMAERLMLSLISLHPEPLLTRYLLYFHSYRKVQEGNPELGMMVGKTDKFYRKSRYRYDYEFPMSAFKLHVLRSMMGKASMFEAIEDEESGETLAKLNELVKRYAGGTIEKLRPSADNTVDFRVYPTGGGESFTFDGLSSGQKEIISTLFLIWYYSRTSPCVVLIDEPELHLNVEWHHDFIDQVFKLAPHNQYIIATHSEDIFASVGERHRVLLVGSEENRP